MSLQFIGFMMAFLILGIGLDGAFYWRFTNLLKAFYEVPSEFTYRYFIFPRVIFITVALIVVAVGSSQKPPNTAMIVAGCAAFLAFSMYPHVIIFRRSKRIR